MFAKFILIAFVKNQKNVKRKNKVMHYFLYFFALSLILVTTAITMTKTNGIYGTKDPVSVGISGGTVKLRLKIVT